MKSERILRAIGKIDDELIEDASITLSKEGSAPVWGKWASIAACACLIVAGLMMTRLQDHTSIPDSQHSDQPDISMEQPMEPHQHADPTYPDTESEITPVIVWEEGQNEIRDSAFTEWNGKQITLSLFDVLSDEANAGSLIAIHAGVEIDKNFVHNGKTLADYAADADHEDLQYERLWQLLKSGDSLKYGDALYIGGTPSGEKWSKELYDETVATIGQDLISKYIVDGEFRKEQLEKDIAEYNTNEEGPCRIAYRDACSVFYRTVYEETITQLESQNIQYEKRNETELVFFTTVEKFASLSLGDGLYFDLAVRDAA